VAGRRGGPVGEGEAGGSEVDDEGDAGEAAGAEVEVDVLVLRVQPPVPEIQWLSRSVRVKGSATGSPPSLPDSLPVVGVAAVDGSLSVMRLVAGPVVATGTSVVGLPSLVQPVTDIAARRPTNGERMVLM
jgi:hypothetical protein